MPTSAGPAPGPPRVSSYLKASLRPSCDATGAFARQIASVLDLSCDCAVEWLFTPGQRGRRMMVFPDWDPRMVFDRSHPAPSIWLRLGCVACYVLPRSASSPAACCRGCGACRGCPQSDIPDGLDRSEPDCGRLPKEADNCLPSWRTSDHYFEAELERPIRLRVLVGPRNHRIKGFGRVTPKPFVLLAVSELPRGGGWREWAGGAAGPRPVRPRRRRFVVRRARRMWRDPRTKRQRTWPSGSSSSEHSLSPRP